MIKKLNVDKFLYRYTMEEYYKLIKLSKKYAFILLTEDNPDTIELYSILDTINDRKIEELKTKILELLEIEGEK